MFYTETPSPEIRQGDVFEGLVSIGIITSKILTPAILNKEPNPCFSLNLSFNYATVLTPCCDIQKREYLAFCPLFPFPSNIRRNEFLNENPTMLNGMVDPQHAVPKAAWDSISEQEQNMRIQKGKTYIYYHNFVYEKKDGIFGDDMIIDFNYIFNISRKNLGSGNQALLPHRVLQLSKESRESLRRKLGAYFLRDPDNTGCFTSL